MKHRIVIAMLIASCCCQVASAQTKNIQRKTPLDDPRVREETVRRAFDEVSRGMYYSWSEKYLARLGDSATPDIMDILNTRGATQGNCKTAVALVEMAFAMPANIRHDGDKVPTKTRSLLDYLEQHSNDSDTKFRIDTVRKKIDSTTPTP